MIVTCPGCASKYRVRNEAVPAEGARMRCPKCETLFLAKPPAAGEASDDVGAEPAHPPTLTPPGSPTAFQPQAFPPGFSVSPALAAPGAAVQPPAPAPAFGSFGGRPMGSSSFGALVPTKPFSPFDDDVPSPSSPQNDDPFAQLDLGGPPPLGTDERSRPNPAPRPLTAPTASFGASPPVRVMHEPSVVATIGSYVVLVAAAAMTIGGITFAGWTSESLRLDASLMPVFEARFGVRPPFSFHNAVIPAEELRRQAEAKEAQGDLAGAVVAWRRVQAHHPDDKAAVTALPRVMTALGERLR